MAYSERTGPGSKASTHTPLRAGRRMLVVTCWRGAGAQALKNTGRAIRCFPELLPIFPPSVKLGRFYIFFISDLFHSKPSYF